MVAMPAHNAAPFIGAAIESVLSQDGVDVDVVVVDDASTDDTWDIVSSYGAEGVHALRNPERRGIGFCHNRIIAETDHPLIAHVDADDVIEPGALQKLAAAVTADDRVGQAYCDFYTMDRDGRTTPEERARWERFFRVHRAPPIDYARELVVHGMVVSALRTYRRSVFQMVGGFDERLPWAVDYEMALRVAEHFDFAHVPELLYGRRVHAEGASQRLRAKPLRHWWMRQRLVRRRLREGSTGSLEQGALRTRARLVEGLFQSIRGLATRESGP